MNDSRTTPESISEAKAAEILYAAHEAWNRRDLAGLLQLFDDAMTYWSNVGGQHGGTAIEGKPAFLDFLDPLKDMEGLSVPHSLRFRDGTISASVEFYLRDRPTGHSHSGTFRQVLSFRGGRILRMEEFHDAAALSSFMALLGSESSAS
jgi:ketosteroid isomerase-like protein